MIYDHEPEFSHSHTTYTNHNLELGKQEINVYVIDSLIESLKQLFSFIAFMIYFMLMALPISKLL